jgi:hypothetical protein
MENFEEPLGDERRRLLEQELRKDLHQFLLSMKEVDERMPECPDVEEKWEEIAKTYIPDGIREFQDFPSASLGWMMYIGMAVAKMWDTEWEIYSKIEDLYAYMRDKRGYDAMDEYIREDVLLLQGVDYSVLEKVTDMFGFWKNRLTDNLIDAVKADDGVLIHLATEEYQHLFDWQRVRKEVRIVQPLFYVRKGNDLKMQAVWAKTCRGAMTRFIIENRIDKPEDLCAFSYEGFSYEPKLGEPDYPHFIKN